MQQGEIGKTIAIDVNGSSGIYRTGATDRSLVVNRNGYGESSAGTAVQAGRSNRVHGVQYAAGVVDKGFCDQAVATSGTARQARSVRGRPGKGAGYVIYHVKLGVNGKCLTRTNRRQEGIYTGWAQSERYNHGNRIANAIVGRVVVKKPSGTRRYYIRGRFNG